MKNIPRNFKNGDQVVLPPYGVGIVSGTTTKTIAGADLQYYQVEFPNGTSKAYVPVKSPQEAGLRPALTGEEVKRCNQAIDHHIGQLREMQDSLAGGSGALAGTSHRKDMGGLLSWDRPWCEHFRKLLVHPNVSPYLDTILGKSYRLDHGPSLIAMDEGTEGGTLHGGGIERPNFSEAYFFKDGRIYCGLTVVEFMLADEGSGDGGLGLIPGSHKANFSCPFDMDDASSNPMAEPVLAGPGDVVVFSEGMTHNAYPVTNSTIRRSIFFNYMPAIGRNNLPFQRMSIYPDHVLQRLPDQADMLTSAGYI